MKSTMLFIAMAMILVTSCTARISDEPRPLTTGQEVYDLGFGGRLQVVTLKDGTVCAAYTNVYGGGLDCNWKSQP